MREHAKRTDHATMRESDKVGSDLVAFVDFEFFRDTLLYDEYVTAQGKCCRHQRGQPTVIATISVIECLCASPVLHLRHRHDLDDLDPPAGHHLQVGMTLAE